MLKDKQNELISKATLISKDKKVTACVDKLDAKVQKKNGLDNF